MSRLVIVVEKASDWGSYYPSDNVVTAQDYLKQPIGSDDERTQVINLCRSYKYLGTGYYVSLLGNMLYEWRDLHRAPRGAGLPEEDNDFSSWGNEARW